MPGKPCKYCLSLLPRTTDEIWDNPEQFQQADLLEIRLDLLGNKLNLKKLRRVVKLPLIITLRSRTEGGEWSGTLQEKTAILQKAIKAGMDYIDLEWSEAEKILPTLNFTPQTRLILSHHTADREAESLLNTFQQMLQQSADIYKFIYTARSLADNLTAYRLLETARQRGIRFVIHAMGKEGQLSRLISALQGNEFNYVSIRASAQTAEGQLTLNTARNIFFLHEKSEETRLIGLLGYPIEQSLGWRLHNQLLHIKRQESAPQFNDFIYVNFPAVDFQDFWKDWESRVSGLSITLPHKTKIISPLDFSAKSVEVSGVCNTAIKRDNKWWGFNTDLMAIFEVLQPHKDLLQEGLLIYGAGATSRSSIAAMQELGVRKIFLASRDESKGSQLAEEFQIEYLNEHEWLKQYIPAIIHTTPLGMYPAVQEMPPLSMLLPRAKLVFDVVYNPSLTRLLQEAKKLGCQIISGEEMFLRQASQQFQIFSGLMVTLEELKKLWDKIKSQSVSVC
jgi:3-dehydroquinate dehydratase/shikimate dehydrogenase